MAQSIGNGGYNFPVDYTKRAAGAPASAPKAEAFQAPGDTSDINFSYSTPSAKAETPAHVKTAAIDNAPVTSFKGPSSLSGASNVPVTMALGEIGTGLLGKNDDTSPSQWTCGILAAGGEGFHSTSGRQYTF